MLLNDLLIRKGIDPEQVLVMRHRPHERQLNKVLPWLAADRPFCTARICPSHVKRMGAASVVGPIVSAGAITAIRMRKLHVAECSN